MGKQIRPNWQIHTFKFNLIGTKFFALLNMQLLQKKIHNHMVSRYFFGTTKMFKMQFTGNFTSIWKINYLKV